MITTAGQRAMRKAGGPTLDELRAAGGRITRRYDPTRGRYVVSGADGRTLAVANVEQRTSRKPPVPKRRLTAEQRREIVANARLELETYKLNEARERSREREAQYRREYDRGCGNHPPAA